MSDALDELKNRLKDSGLSDEDIEKALAAFKVSLVGPTLNTIFVRDKDGAVAHRVEENGIRFWRITGNDGNSYIDSQTDLPKGWTKINDPHNEVGS